MNAGKQTTVIIGTAAVTITVAEAFALPPGPVAVPVYVTVAGYELAVGVTVINELHVAPVVAGTRMRLVAFVQLIVSVVVFPAVIVVGLTLIVTVGGGAVTVIVAEPDTFVNPACNEVAVHVADPKPLGVSAPPEVIVPPVAVQVTPVLKAPLPCTIAVQVAVCAVVIVAGEADTVTEVTVTGAGLTTTEPEPLVVPPGPVAVTVYVKVPVAKGVAETVPLHVTDPDKLPDPAQLVAFAVTMVSTVDWPNVIAAGEAVTVTVGAGVVLPPLPVLSVPLLPHPAVISMDARAASAMAGTARVGYMKLAGRNGSGGIIEHICIPPSN